MEKKKRPTCKKIIIKINISNFLFFLKSYNFMPLSYTLPSEYSIFFEEFKKHNSNSDK